MEKNRPLEGRRALVTGGETGYGASLLAALRTAGAQAEALPQPAPDREATHAAFAAAAGALGGLDVLVHAALDPTLLSPRALCETSTEQWVSGCEGWIQSSIFVMQAAHTALCERGGSIVIVAPTLSTVGAAELVPLTTALEAIRVLAKSAAKQWGPAGIRVNSLAPAIDAFFAEGSAPRVSLGEPALPGFDPDRDAAGPLTFLASDASAKLTGATLRVDGGVWTPG